MDLVIHAIIKNEQLFLQKMYNDERPLNLGRTKKYRNNLRVYKYKNAKKKETIPKTSATMEKGCSKKKLTVNLYFYTLVIIIF